MGKQVKWTPPEEDEVVTDSAEPVKESAKDQWSPPADDEVVSEPVKKKDQTSQETSSNASQELGTPSGKSGANIQLTEAQKITLAKNTQQKTPEQLQREKNSRDFQETSAKEYVGIAEDKSKGLIHSFVSTIESGLSDQIPKEYYTQRLRMSKGSFGDLYDSRSDLNAFGGDKFMEALPKGTSIDAFKEWNNKQPFAVKQKSYDERAKLFLTEKLGSKGFEDLKSKFATSNTEQRIGFEKNIEEQNLQAQQKLGGVVQSLEHVNGAEDFLSFAGNMIGQAVYRTPITLTSGPTGSIISESASVYDRQLDLIAQDKGITREEVIRRGLDKPAEGQALGVLAGTLDALSEVNIISMFRKAAAKELTESMAKKFAKGFIRGAAPEAITETTQGELEEFAASKGANVDYKVDPWRIATSAVGGIIGGGPIGGIATLTQTEKQMPTEEVVKSATEAAVPDNVPSMEKAADIIDAKVQNSDEATVAQEKVNQADIAPPVNQTVTDTHPTTENLEENAVSQSKTTSLLQPPQEGTGSEGGERGRVEPVEQGNGTTGESTQQEESQTENPEQTQKVEGVTNPDENIQQQSQAEAGVGGAVQGTQEQTQQGEGSGESGSVSRVDRQEEVRSEEIPEPVKKRQGVKSLLNRAYEGVTDEQVKSSIEKHGLNYEVESHASAERSASDFIKEVGIDNALDAVRKSEVDDGAAAFVWSKAIDEVGKKLSSAKDKTEIQQLTDMQTKLIDEFDKKARSGGRFISALQEVYKSSDFAYKLDYQIKKYKEVNNGKIPKAVEEKFVELDKKLREANEKIQKLEEEQKSSSSKKSVQEIRKDFQIQKERRAKVAQARKEKIDSFFDSLKVKSDPNKLNSITQVIGESVWNGSIEVMRKAVLAGADVAQAIQAGIDYINEHYRGNDFNQEQFTSTVRPGIEKLVATEDEVSTHVPEMKNGKLSIPREMIREAVEGGAGTIEELTDKIHAIVEKTMPGISTREVRDAITKYGETRSLSKEEIDVKVRELKRIGRLVSSLEDVQNKLRPLRSGVQRDKLTDQERRMQREIKEAMKDLPVDQAELDKEWATALDAVKSRLKNQIVDLEEQIKSGEKPAKKKGIKYDEEANLLKQQRDNLKETLQQLNGKNGLSDEQKVRSAINSVEKSIAEFEQRIKDKNFEPRPISTTPETPELKALREQRDKLKETYKQLEKDLGIADKKRLENYKKTLKKSIDRYETRIKNKDFVTEKKKPVTADKEATDLKLERDRIKQQFEIEQEKNRMANRSLSEKTWDTFVDVVNLPKSMLASIDMSAPFRQGALLSAANPKAGAASFAEMFRQAFSEKKASEWLLKLKESPEYDLIKRSKLYLAEPTTRLTAKEDQFISNIASKIPVFKVLYKASERAYTGFLNKLRVDVFANGADRLMESGITPESNIEAYKAWADFVNNATGRGNLGAMEEAATVLNGFFFSPRFVASRVNLLNPVKYAKMPPEVRKMAMRNVIAYTGFVAVVLGIAAAAGAEVEDDPRSTDFAKIKIDNTRYDIMAGFQQVIRLIAQLTSGQRKVNGKIVDINGKQFPFETRGDVALRFVRSKLSPSAGTAVNLLTGKDIVGNEVTIQGEAVKNVIPLYLQDISSMYQSEGPTGLLTSMVPAFFGVGVQNYSKNKKPKKELSPWQ